MHRMKSQPPLGDQFARLRDIAQAQETCAWIPAAIQDLIMACLMRIFGRLEQLVRLWQAGALPLPPIRTASPRARKAATPRAHRHGHRSARVRADETQDSFSQHSPPSAHPGHIAGIAPSRPTAWVMAGAQPRLRRYPARDPPRAGDGSPATGRKRTPIIFRYRN